MKNKGDAKQSLPMITNNNEQEVLDACWAGTALGSKLRDKIMKRIERTKEINKFQYPLTARGQKQVNRVAQGMKDMGRRNMSSVVLVVEEHNRRKTYKLPNARNSARISTILRCTTPQTNPMDCSLHGKVSAKDNYMTNSRVPKKPLFTERYSVLTEKTNKSICPENSGYKTLKDQLHKISLKLGTGKSTANESSISGLKQRRTREERSSRNLNAINSSSRPLQPRTNLTSPLQIYQKVMHPNVVQESHKVHVPKKESDNVKRQFATCEFRLSSGQSHNVGEKNAILKSKAKPVKNGNEKTLTVGKKGVVPLKSSRGVLDESLVSKGTFNSGNLAKKPNKQKENIQLNKTFRTNMALNIY